MVSIISEFCVRCNHAKCKQSIARFYPTSLAMAAAAQCTGRTSRHVSPWDSANGARFTRQWHGPEFESRLDLDLAHVCFVFLILVNASTYIQPALVRRYRYEYEARMYVVYLKLYWLERYTSLLFKIVVGIFSSWKARDDNFNISK